MNRALTLFPRFLTGLVELEGVHFTSPTYFSRDLIPYGIHNQSVGLIDNPFTSVYASNVYNRNGKLEVNRLTSRDPLKTALLDGTADISLTYDGTLQIVDGA